MRPGLLGLALLVGVGLTGNIRAASLDEGIAAFRTQDYAEAFEIFDALAHQGDSRAIFYLSLLYDKGLGVIPNPEYSLQLLRQAAEAGDPQAQYNLGNQYNRGGPLGHDPALALAWWKKAAEQGLVLAQHNLGSLYALGRGVEQDLDKARYWYARAAKNGSKRSAEAIRELDRQAGRAAQSDAASKTTEPAAPRARVEVVTDEWIEGQPANSFTLQLAAVRERRDIERLVERYHWRRGLLLYPIRSGDRVVWALGYGVFPGASGAREATGELPEKLRAGHPWPRALADIRKRLSHPR